jgi:putative transposase
MRWMSRCRLLSYQGHAAVSEGWVVNHKKVQRLWREEGRRLPQRRRRKRHGTSTATGAVSADVPNRVWAVDFSVRCHY